MGPQCLTRADVMDRGIEIHSTMENILCAFSRMTTSTVFAEFISAHVNKPVRSLTEMG